MNALRCALVLLLAGCSKKADLHQDPSAKPIAEASASASATAVVAPSVELPAADAFVPKRRLVKMIETATDIQGALPPADVKRVIRASFPQFRECYEAGLKKDLALKGTIGVRFVIDSAGAVGSVSSTGGTLKDKSVSDCVLDLFRKLTFPAPDAGTVKVTYPIDFQYEEGVAQDGMGYGGCPCGCDHSEDMVAELRGLDRSTALAAIDESLRTIGEREDAGYITDRMVRHRLRLLAFGGELGRASPARFTTIPAIGPHLVSAIGTTKVGARFIFHGETTELVKGKEKLLRAVFVLRLDLENTGPATVTLHTPTLDAKMPLPVSRWYVAGSDGQPWDGALAAGAKKLVHVIGYAGEAVKPGANVEATVHFESLELKVKARARGSWNQVD